MVVIAVGDAHQRLGGARNERAVELFGVGFVEYVQPRRDAAVDAVIDEHVLYPAAAAENELGLLDKFAEGVAALEHPPRVRGAAEHVAAVGGDDLVPRGAEDGYILHYDLAGDGEFVRQYACGNGSRGVAEQA